ncbi:MAG: M48 family metallopeptidase [Dehalococcoidia bacterium]|nr:M48 family metallopeptidase [Dehalococcoidia bacterium]
MRAEAEALNRAYFGGNLTIVSISYADMTSRHGSCSTGSGTIRISRQLADAPAWVRQSVIHHELCHLLESGHGPAFRALAARYPYTQQANDYLRLLERLPRDVLTSIDRSDDG